MVRACNPKSIAAPAGTCIHGMEVPANARLRRDADEGEDQAGGKTLREE